MTLGQKQRLFAKLLPRLIDYIYGAGYEVSFGETYRSPEEAARLARLGKGIKNSLHTQRLAIDLNLFKDGHYLTRTEHHAQFGTFWESLHPLCRWGGRFNDGNHYSLAHGGRA